METPADDSATQALLAEIRGRRTGWRAVCERESFDPRRAILGEIQRSLKVRGEVVAPEKKRRKKKSEPEGPQDVPPEVLTGVLSAEGVVKAASALEEFERKDMELELALLKHEFAKKYPPGVRLKATGADGSELQLELFAGMDDEQLDREFEAERKRIADLEAAIADAGESQAGTD